MSEKISSTPCESIASQELWDLFTDDYVNDILDLAHELYSTETRIVEFREIVRIALAEGYVRGCDDTRIAARAALAQVLGEVGTMPTGAILQPDESAGCINLLNPVVVMAATNG